MKTLADMNLAEFNAAIASKEPAPGGGSASAMAGAMGVGLSVMVANLTKGKKKYAEHDELMQEIITKASALQESFVSAIDKDTEAYNGVSAVFSMPKETDEDKAERARSMEAALKSATLVPYELMENCGKALDLVESMIGRSNTNCASDLGVAALNLGSAAMGAWMNVMINLSGIKDEEFVQKIKSGGGVTIEKCKKSSQVVIDQVMNGLK